MKYIEDFLNTFSNRYTRNGYRATIYVFLDSRYGSVRKQKDSTQEDRETYEKLAMKYMKGKVSPLTDLKKYKDYLSDIRRPPHSISQGVVCVRIWLEHYGHDLSSKDIRELKKYMPSQRHGVTREGELTPEVLRAVLNHTGDSRLKAAVLLMLSSGIRIGEMTKLTLQDVDLEKNTVYISDLIAKTGVSRMTFFTDECKDAINSYLKEYDVYIERATRLTPRLKKEYKNSSRLFPITTSVIRTSLIATLKRSGIYQTDSRTNRTNIHPHSLRKYFSSTLKLAGMPEDIVEYLMGHTTGLTMAYRTYSESQLREQYKKFEFSLHVDYSYTAQKELKSQMSDAEKEILALKQENAELTLKISGVEEMIKTQVALKLIQLAETGYLKVSDEGMRELSADAS